MGVRSDREFHGGDAKQLIRNQWDRPILEAAAKELGHTLCYFGLPGPHIEDLLAWRDLLGYITGVERLRPHNPEHAEDLRRLRRLLQNISVHDIPNFQLMRGNIEDIIRDTLDVDGNSPALNDGKPPHRMRFRYNLVNLDYLGGIAYMVSDAKQVRALKLLFTRQYGTEFVLLMTINVRDKINREITQYLDNTRERAPDHLRGIVEWYARRGSGYKAYKLKAVIPLFVKRIAEDSLFLCHAFPAVYYEGTGGAEMIHFAFRLTPVPGNLRAFSPQTDEHVLYMPMMSVSQGSLRVADLQHDGFDFSRCPHELHFLPTLTRESVLDNLPQAIRLSVTANE